MKILGLLLASLYFMFPLKAMESPNETKIFLHLHQATRWAELSYSGKCLFSKRGIENHLIEVKYTEPSLVDSIFHKDYIFIRNFAFTQNEVSFSQIERFREIIHTKAEKLNIEHPKNWRNEFYICSYGMKSENIE